LDFFEKLGKRISDVGSSVAQNTKNFADSTSLQKGISDSKKKIEQLYTAIGKAYYENHKNDPAAEEIATIGEINTLFAQIEENNEKIKALKGFVKCENCGADVAPDAAFCNNCGTKVVKAAPAPAPVAAAGAQPLCPNCGNVVAEGNLFCNNCGTKIIQSAPVAAPAPTARLCPTCGNAVGEDNLFCNNCGTKL
jgi:uncharacterized OB-fold protein